MHRLTLFIYSLMTDKRNESIYKPLKVLLYIISLLYGAALFIRKALYKLGIFKSNKIPMKVISVGNLTIGGTGKTPFVIAIAGILEEELKKRVAVLTRGYGWDESAMLKKNLKDTPIVIGEDRARSGFKAIRLYGSDTAILDDGFQHWELKRDLDIVLIDSRNPFGNNRLFPRGILRESKREFKRADVAVFTKTDKFVASIEKLKEDLLSINSDVIFLEARHKPDHIYDMKTRITSDISFLKDKRVVLLSSIGDPDYFAETVRGLGAKIARHLIYSDHYDYRKRDIEDIRAACDELKPEFVLTTEKDAVKLVRLGLYIINYTVYVLSVKIEISAGRSELIDRLNRLYIS